MKQHITFSQWEELSAKDKLKLDRWLMKKGYFLTYMEEYSVPKRYLSIGQMIEFLDEQYTNGNRFSLSIERGNNGWILWELGDEHKKLCDALWEAVKQVLEEEKL